MANKPLKGINFPGLEDTYTVLSMSNGTVTLVASNWYLNTDGLYQIDCESVDYVAADVTVVVAPNPATENFNAYIENGVRCIDQGVETLAFVANTQPTVDITVNYTVFA